MAWISRILYFLLFLVGLRLIASLLTRVLTSSKDIRARSGAGSNQARRTIAGQMIKDPQCGMYVATDLAVTAKVNGETFHFCSEECRNHFINEQERNNRTNRQAV
ncbi:MAG: YHS domain-containing protein [Acidobacteria bacterium]|nr:YHS domain-containing protein [Acidobacteriota bacterium]